MKFWKIINIEMIVTMAFIVIIIIIIIIIIVVVVVDVVVNVVVSINIIVIAETIITLIILEAISIIQYYNQIYSSHGYKIDSSPYYAILLTYVYRFSFELFAYFHPFCSKFLV